MAKRRWWVIGLGAVGGLMGVALMGVAGLGVFLSTDRGGSWLSEQVEGALTNDETGMRGSVGDVHTDLWTGARVDDFELTMDGMVVKVGRLDADIDRNALLSGKLRFKKAVAHGVFIDLTASEEVSEEPFSGLGIDLGIDAVDLHGAQVIYRTADGTEVTRVVGASGTARFEAVGSSIQVNDLDVRALVGLSGAAPAMVKGDIEVNEKGTFLKELDVRLPTSELVVDGSIEDELDIDVTASRLALRDVDPILSSPGVDGTVKGTASVSGPTDNIAWTADLQGIDGTEGAMEASGGVDTSGERLGWTVDATLDELDVQQLYPGLGEDPVVLTGRAVLDGKGTSYPSDFDLTVNWSGTKHDAYGQKIDAAQATIRISEGVVTLENTTLDGIVGDLTITGTVDAADGPMNLRATGTLKPSRLRELGVTGIDSSGWVDATIVGDISDPDNPIVVDGTVRFAPFVSGESLRFEEVVAGYHVEVRGEVVEGSASVAATTGDAGGIAIEAATVDKLAFTQGPAGLEVAGDVTVTSLDMEDSFTVGAASGLWTVDDEQITAALALSRPTLLGRAGTGGQVTVDLRGDDLAFAVSMAGDDGDLVSTAGTMNLDRSTIGLDHLRFAPTPSTTWVDDHPIQLRLTDAGGITDADIALRTVDGTGRIAVTGQLGTTGPLDGRVAITDLDLGWVAELMPESLEGLDGTLDLDATLTGTGQAAILGGTVDLDGLVYGEQVDDLHLDGTFDTREGNLVLGLDVAAGADSVARIQGDLPLILDLSRAGLDPDGTVDLTLALTPGPFNRLARLSPENADSIPVGQGSLVLEMDGPFAQPDLHLGGVVEAIIPGWDDAARVEFELVRAEGSTTGWADVRRGYQALAQTFTVAQLDLEPALRPLLSGQELPEDFDNTGLVKDLYVTGALLEIPVNLLAAAGGVDDVVLRGRMTGGFQASGTPSDPVLDLAVNWIDGRIGRQRLDGLDLQLTHTDIGYDVNLDMRFPDEGDFQVTGSVPVDVDLAVDPEQWATDNMNLTFGGTGVPLRVLTAVDPTITQVQGLVKMTGEIGGTAFDPDPDLQVLLEGGALTIDELGIRVENLLVKATGDRDQVELLELAGTTRPSKGQFDLKGVTEGVAEGIEGAIADLDPNAPENQPDSSFRGGGQLTLVDGGIGEVQGRIRLNNGTWVIRTNDLQLRLDGRIRATGTWPELNLGGNLSLRQGLVKLDAAAFVDRAPLEPDPRIAIVRSGDTARREEEEGPSYLDQMTASVALDLRRALEFEVSMPFVDDLGSLGAFVSRADLFARLGGEAQLAMNDGEMSMVGELELNDGRLRMLSRRFDVEQGSITFTGQDIAEPRLDIKAKTNVSNVPITASVSGTPSSPSIDPSCEGYPSQSDCLMILITGSTPDGEGGNSSALAALSSMALGGVLGEQNVADLSIEPDGTVLAGASIANGVYATYSFAPKADIGENQNTGELDVGLSRRVTLNIGVGDTRSWTDLFWEIRF